MEQDALLCDRQAGQQVVHRDAGRLETVAVAEPKPVIEPLDDDLAGPANRGGAHVIGDVGQFSYDLTACRCNHPDRAVTTNDSGQLIGKDAVAQHLLREGPKDHRCRP